MTGYNPERWLHTVTVTNALKHVVIAEFRDVTLADSDAIMQSFQLKPGEVIGTRATTPR